jgi:hypothetical protein
MNNLLKGVAIYEIYFWNYYISGRFGWISACMEWKLD